MLMLLILIRLLLCLIMADTASLFYFMVKLKELHNYPIFFCLRELFLGSMFFLLNLFKSKPHYFKRN